MTGRLSGLIPAAGLSSRMRGFKPLYPLGQATVIERVIALFRETGIADVIVVTGHRAGELEPVVRAAGARPVRNDRYEQGMFTSICTGVEALDQDCSGFFLLPVDIPLVRPRTLARLAQAFAQSAPRIAYPVFLGERGHPPLISCGMIPAILAAGQDPAHEGGLRPVLEAAEAREPGAVLDVPVADQFVLEDMDTEAAYAGLCSRFDSYAAPSGAECRALWDLAGTPGPVRDHCRAVARVAEALALAVNLRREADKELDAALIRSAALLHDAAKGRPGHEQEGAALAREWGFAPLAPLIAAHRDFEPGTGPVPGEELVFLADKVVAGARPLDMEERFGQALERFGHDPDAREAILDRREHGRAARQRFEAESGRDLMDLANAALNTRGGES